MNLATTTTAAATPDQQFDEQTLPLIEEDVRRLLTSMGFTEATVRCQEATTREAGDDRTTLQVNIEAGDEGKLLIGVRGNHLLALQHVVRCVLRHKLNAVSITCDVNGYRARRERSLAQVAEAAARRATMQGRTVVLRPMEAYDRRCVHTALAQRSDVTTESMGDEPNRRVVVKPVFL